MIVDFHTHIFPPQVRDNRDGYVRRDPTLAEMYGSPKAAIATAAELLASMDEAGIDVSVALGFAWRDHHDCARHNDYLLEAASKSGGRIVPFCTTNFDDVEAAEREARRCAAAGARGLGELRPDSQGWSLDGVAGEALAALARKLGLVLLFHVTEEGDREYAGKLGLPVASFRRFVERESGVTVVGAHLAGGLPLDAGAALPDGVFADTAALRYLHEPSALAQVASALGSGRLLFGSDYPLIGQAAAIEDVRKGGLDEATLRGVLGDNAARLLGL
ncbi:MAG: amidohydrolase family protein [Dehalococcoidia bacterium]